MSAYRWQDIASPNSVSTVVPRSSMIAVTRCGVSARSDVRPSPGRRTVGAVTLGSVVMLSARGAVRRSIWPRGRNERLESVIAPWRAEKHHGNVLAPLGWCMNTPGWEYRPRRQRNIRPPTLTAGANGGCFARTMRGTWRIPTMWFSRERVCITSTASSGMTIRRTCVKRVTRGIA